MMGRFYFGFWIFDFGLPIGADWKKLGVDRVGPVGVKRA
jgi:hypothetical protein